MREAAGGHRPGGKDRYAEAVAMRYGKRRSGVAEHTECTRVFRRERGGAKVGCVAGDAWVSTEDGLRRADELYLARRAVSVVVDGRMLAGPVRVASPVVLAGVRPLVEVRTREGFAVRVTPDHRMLTETRGWVEAAALRAGETVRVVDHPGGFGREGSAELGRLLGYLSAAARRRDESLQLAFLPGRDEEIRPLLERSLEEALALGRSGEGSRGKRSRALAAQQLAELAFAHGLASMPPTVPVAAYRGTAATQASYVEAFFEAAGHVRVERGRPVLVAAGEFGLLQGVQRVLLNLGVYARIRSAGGRRPGAGDRAQIRVERDGLIRFAQEIGAQTPQRRRMLVEAQEALRHARFVPERFVAHVAWVREEGEEPVFDLVEPVTRSFVASGLVVHQGGAA